MNAGQIAVRAVFSYIFLLALLRSSGKRSVGEGTPLDFVMALVLGDLVDDAIWAEVPISTFVSAAGSIILLHVVLSALEFKFTPLARLIQGTPVVASTDGRLHTAAKRAEHIPSLEVYMLQRECGIADSREVKELRIETSGRPSVIKHVWARVAQKADRQRVKETQA